MFAIPQFVPDGSSVSAPLLPVPTPAEFVPTFVPPTPAPAPAPIPVQFSPFVPPVFPSEPAPAPVQFSPPPTTGVDVYSIPIDAGSGAPLVFVDQGDGTSIGVPAIDQPSYPLPSGTGPLIYPNDPLPPAPPVPNAPGTPIDGTGYVTTDRPHPTSPPDDPTGPDLPYTSPPNDPYSPTQDNPPVTTSPYTVNTNPDTTIPPTTTHQTTLPDVSSFVANNKPLLIAGAAVLALLFLKRRR